VAVFLLIRWEQFSYSAEMQQALIFWPLHLLVLRAVVVPCPVRLCAVEDGRHGPPRICVERGLGGIVIVTPIVVEVWMLSWWNDRGHVELGRGSRALADYAWSRLSHRWERVPRLWGPRGLSSCQRVTHVPRVRRK
jgi:hypothetical protein